jgi:hypothetical protein
MRKRLLNIAAACSALAFCVFLAACFIAGAINSAKTFLRLGRDVHISLDVRSGDPRLEIFNDTRYGPYRGSIVEVSGPGRPSQVKSVGFDFLGVYYRRFRWPNGTTLCTLSLSLVYFVVLSAVLPFAWLARHRRPACLSSPRKSSSSISA